MKKYELFLCIAGILAIMLTTSCGSRRNTATIGYPSEQESAIPSNTAEDTYSSLISSYKPWHDVTISVKLNLRQPKRFTVSGKATMVNNKAINVSVRMLGMEMASIYVDSDSIYVMSKFQRIAYVESMTRLRDAYGIGIADLQCLLLGQAIGLTSDTSGANNGKQLDLKVDNGEFEFSSTKKDVSMVYSGKVPTLGVPAYVTQILVKSKTLQPITASFEEQRRTEAGIVASIVDISGTLRNKKIEASADWSLDGAQWNRNISMESPSIPSGYTRISTQQLLEMLNKL